MAAASQVKADGPTSEPTNISQCRVVTPNTISLCWTASGKSGSNVGNNIKSYYITNATEVCNGLGEDRVCTFGSDVGGVGFGSQLPSFNLGLNRTGGPSCVTSATCFGGAGTGSDATVANFTGLGPGQVFKFIIYGENDHGTSVASTAFIATTS